MENKLQKDSKNKKIIFIISAVVLLAIIVLMFLLYDPKYKVTFDSNGGSSVSSVIVKRNNKIEKPQDPTKEGYIFDGWYYNDELYDFNMPVNQNIRLEARWKMHDNADITGVILDVTQLTLKVGEKATLKVTIQPEDAKNNDIIWSSSDDTIVKVDEKGNITALKEGKAIITVKTVEGEYTANCTITVSKDVKEVTAISVSGPKEVMVNESITLTATITPTNAINKNIIWKSSNTSIAKVDKNGKVTGLKPGTVTITATSADGKVSTTYKITIKPKPNSTKPEQPNEKEILPTSISISGSTQVNVNESITLTAKVQPSNATNKNVTWKSSNPSIAKVDKNGKVTGLKEGTATIIAISADGNKQAKHTITVKSIYTITLTAMTKETGVFQYAISVKKDGNEFSGYTGVKYNGRTAPFKQYIAKKHVNTSVSTAQIILNNGRVTAKVLYK